MSAVDPLQSSLFFSAQAQAAQNKRKENEKKTARASSPQFGRLLEQSKAEATEDADVPFEAAGLGYDEAVQVLLDSVYASADALKKSFSAQTIVPYKKAVRDFLRFVVKNSYDIDAQESARSVKKRKKFYMVQVINQKLDALAAGVLYNNRDQLQMLAKIEEINGLLVDLVS